jgi:hypothetical protein
MTTAGGGWTLVAHSAPGNTANWGCNGYPSGTTFNWTSSTGTVTDDASAYNISAASLPFSQILFGNYSSGKTWGAYVYEHNVPADFLTAYTTTPLWVGYPTPIAGGETSAGMFVYIGNEDTATYHFRDNTGPAFGLSTLGWASCYGYQGTGDGTTMEYWGGHINASQGMIMAR